MSFPDSLQSLRECSSISRTDMSQVMSLLHYACDPSLDTLTHQRARGRNVSASWQKDAHKNPIGSSSATPARRGGRVRVPGDPARRAPPPRPISTRPGRDIANVCQQRPAPHSENAPFGVDEEGSRARRRQLEDDQTCIGMHEASKL